MKSANGATDPLVVSTELLAQEVDEWFRKHNAKYPARAYRVSVNQSDFISAGELLEQESGVPARSVYRIRKRETKFTAYNIADRLLIAIGTSYKLSNGEIPSVANPYWSKEKWMEYMNQCI